jgi:hypothetical protein
VPFLRVLTAEPQGLNREVSWLRHRTQASDLLCLWLTNPGIGSSCLLRRAEPAQDARLQPREGCHTRVHPRYCQRYHSPLMTPHSLWITPVLSSTSQDVPTTQSPLTQLASLTACPVPELLTVVRPFHTPLHTFALLPT